ncbi:hypothetical protein JHK85_027887 [Glycine max]|nr:hypothetical protein JHK85_027887 [Glycine max]
MSEALPRTVTFAITQLVCTGCPQPSIPNFTPHFRSQLRLMKEYESHIRRVATQLPFMIEAPSYQLNDDDVRYFEGILDTKNVVQDEGKLVTSNTDWMHKYKGSKDQFPSDKYGIKRVWMQVSVRLFQRHKQLGAYM